MALRIALVAAITAAVISATLLGSPGSASPAAAQGFPPPLPTTYFGVATGATDGSLVTAYVVNGVITTKCGTGLTLTDGADVVYVVDVAQDGQTLGCGKAGRQVKLTFKAPGELVARPATTTADWVSVGPGYAGAEFDVVLGVAPPLVRRALTPFIARAQ